MKKIFFLLLLVHSYASKSQIKHVSYSFSSSSGKEAHLSANTFVKMVHDSLIHYFPSRVNDISVLISNRKGVFTFSWNCYLYSCKNNEADYHFDRRGTLLSGKTLDEARKNVESELAKSRKIINMINGFKNKYGSYAMPKKFDIETFTKEGPRYWYLREFFCVASK